jgi:hypothetical protein
VAHIVHIKHFPVLLGKGILWFCKNLNEEHINAISFSREKRTKKNPITQLELRWNWVIAFRRHHKNSSVSLQQPTSRSISPYQSTEVFPMNSIEEMSYEKNLNFMSYLKKLIFVQSRQTN